MPYLSLWGGRGEDSEVFLILLSEKKKRGGKGGKHALDVKRARSRGIPALSALSPREKKGEEDAASVLEFFSPTGGGKREGGEKVMMSRATDPKLTPSFPYVGKRKREEEEKEKKASFFSSFCSEKKRRRKTRQQYSEHNVGSNLTSFL